VGAGLSKGDLDLCVRVSASEFMAARDALARLFDTNPGSDSTPTFASYVHAHEWVGVQLCTANGPDDTFVRVRDLLRTNVTILAAYDELKQRYEGEDMSRYRQAKSAFIERLLADTLA